MDKKEEQECCCLSSCSGDESVSSAIESDDRQHLSPDHCHLLPAGYHATASAMFSTTSSRRNVLTMTIAQIRVVLTSLDTRGYIENHRQRTGEG